MHPVLRHPPALHSEYHLLLQAEYQACGPGQSVFLQQFSDPAAHDPGALYNNGRGQKDFYT